MDDYVVKLHLLLGKPIHIEKLGNIHPLTLGEILNIGLEKYFLYVYVLTKKVEGIKTYKDMFYIFCDYEDYRKLFIEASSLFLKDEVIFYPEYKRFTVGTTGVIHENNFSDFIKIIKKQNFINDKDEEIKPVNKTAQRMLEKMKEFRERVAKKKKNNDGIGLVEIISSLCAKHPSINLINIKDLTLYQIYDQFTRLGLIENYEINIESLLHGASKDEIELKHWTSKI